MNLIQHAKKESAGIRRMVSQTQCRNLIAVLIVLVVLMYYYLPTISTRISHFFENDDDSWTMYPRKWVTLEDAPRHYTSFTLTTYNILNDGFLRRVQKEYNGYSSCTEESLNVTYRQKHILKEIQTIDSDIFCMQEIDYKWYHNYWYSKMVELGYDGALGVDLSHRFKAGQATFWKKDKFKLLNQEQHQFHDLAKPFIENTMKGEEAAEFSKWLKRRSLILITHLQQVSSGSKVIVGCTHISAVQYIEPAVQLFQVSLALQALQSFAEITGQGNSALILTGDLNTPPFYPAYNFIQTAKLTEKLKTNLKERTHTDDIKPEWKSFATDIVNILPEAAFSHNLKLASAYKTVMHTEPSLTCNDYTLDYIWYSVNSLGVSATLLEPNNSNIMKQQTKESCYIFPSDHIPVSAKLYFITNKRLSYKI